MEKLTIKDLKHAIVYVNQGNEGAKNVQNISDEEFLNCKFGKDLHMGNIRVANVIIELQRIHGIELLMGELKVGADDTVKSFLDAINESL